MNWTFGIITAGSSPHLVSSIESIRRFGPQGGSQIVVVGGDNEPLGADLWIPFNETIKAGWITLKKNIIAHVADNEPICFMHDYISLEPGWHEGVEQFGYEWLTCMHRVLNKNGDRYRDWCTISHDAGISMSETSPPPPYSGRMLRYTNHECGRWQYYSGAYFCAKKSVMMRVPMNNDLLRCQSEDVEWSRRLYNMYGQSAFTMNTWSAVRFQKHKANVPWQQMEPL